MRRVNKEYNKLEVRKNYLSKYLNRLDTIASNALLNSIIYQNTVRDALIELHIISVTLETLKPIITEREILKSKAISDSLTTWIES